MTSLVFGGLNIKTLALHLVQYESYNSIACINSKYLES